MSDIRRRNEGIVDRAVNWVLLDGSRWAVAIGSLVPIAVVLGWMAATKLLVVTNTGPLQFLFSAFVGGNFILITVVLSVNQLVLSRQLKAPDEVRSQINEIHDYRNEVESYTQRDVVPVFPPEFFLLLLETARRQAQDLGGLVIDHAPEGLQSDVNELVEAVTTRIDRTHELYDRSDAGILEILIAALDTNYAGQIRDAREIKRDHQASLPESGRAEEGIDELIHSLEHIDVARQYLKTLYLQNELARFSRQLLYVGMPAMFTSICVLGAFTTAPDLWAPNPTLRTVVVGVILVGLLPLAVLFAVVLRIATVSEKTIAITPFTTAEQESGQRSE